VKLSEARVSVPGDTAERILDAAEALFAEQGFAATSVREIAGEVGLTPASLYNHFSGKEALYEAVLERGVQPLLILLQELTTSEPEGDLPIDIIDGVMAHLGTRPHLPRLIQQEVVTGGVYLGTLAKEWIRPLLTEGVLAMERADTVTWNRGDYPHLIAMWVQVVFGHFTMAPILGDVLGEDPLSEEGLESQTRFLRKLANLMYHAGRGEV
jgi:TetR/AcrR family transcriptional regulator